MRMSPFSRYLQFGTSDTPCIYLSYMVLKLSTVAEFTISSVKSFHLQNECILYDFKALGLFSFLLCSRVFKSEYSNIPSIFTSSMLYHVHSISSVV